MARKTTMRTYGSMAVARKYAKIFNDRVANTASANMLFIAETVIDDRGCERYVVSVTKDHDYSVIFYVTKGRFNWNHQENCKLPV
jgi:hypothetical protein